MITFFSQIYVVNDHLSRLIFLVHWLPSPHLFQHPFTHLAQLLHFKPILRMICHSPFWNVFRRFVTIFLDCSFRFILILRCWAFYNIFNGLGSALPLKNGCKGETRKWNLASYLVLVSGNWSALYLILQRMELRMVLGNNMIGFWIQHRWGARVLLRQCCS